MPTYPDGFPQELLDEFARLTGRGTIGNVAGLGHRDHPAARRRAPAHRQVDRLHLGRLGLPDRGARGTHPARGALRGVAQGARDPDRASTPSGGHRAPVHRRDRPLQAHGQPARLLARAGAPEPPHAHPRGGPRRPRRGQDRRRLRRADVNTRARPSRTPRASPRSIRLLARGDRRADLREPRRDRHDLRAPQRPRGLPSLPAGVRRARCPTMLAALRAGRPADPHVGPRLRPDDAVDRPQPRARAAARPRAGRRRAGAPARRLVLGRRGDPAAWLGARDARPARRALRGL